jgi:putative oxidoreductase
MIAGRDIFPALCFVTVIDSRDGASSAASRAVAANTSPAALFQCCFAKRRRFLPAIRFPLKPRHDTNWALRKQGEAIMIEKLAPFAPRALSVLRIVTGLMIIQHGMGKIIGFPVFPAYANVQPLSLIGAAGLIELIGGALLILGLLTRPAAFILSGEMAFAYFMVHAPKSFYPLINGGTLAIMYCFTCLYLSTAGAGPWSVDAKMKQD